MSNATSIQTKPYNRVQLFSGGGYRFGYYVGSYAALHEHNLKPELIVATCGGSLAAMLVDIASDPQDLQALIESEALYQVVKASQHRRNFVNSTTKQKPSYFYQALKRLSLAKSTSRLLNLHKHETYDELLAELNNFAMFEIADEKHWLDKIVSLKNQSKAKQDKAPDITIIASRLLALSSNKDTANLVSSSTAKLQEVLFLPNKLANGLDPLKPQSIQLQCPTHRYVPSRIEKDIYLVTDWDIKQAVRASMADMYYLQPIYIADIGWGLGGVIDLTPIELAAQFGQTVFAETKAGYDKLLAAPAIKRIFGFDPNQRLSEVLSFMDKALENNKHNDIYWLPFADNGKALAGQHVRKRLNMRQGRIDLLHADYDKFVQQMQAQWQYGYERTLRYLQTNALV